MAKKANNIKALAAAFCVVGSLVIVSAAFSDTNETDSSIEKDAAGTTVSLPANNFPTIVRD